MLQVRKYSLVSGMPDEFLLRLFFFHSAKIAEPVHFQGGTITFFYALHALPCIGFRAELGGKSITYSGDTFYDPDGLIKLQERGIISEARRQALLHRGSVQPSDLLLHEAGVAPIHTPIEVLQKLPENVRKGLHLIHIGGKRAAQAAEVGIETVRVGFENTLRVPVPPLQHSDATNILHMLLQTDLFRSLDVNTAIDLLLVTNKRTYKAEEVIFRTGDPGDRLRIVQSGSVMLERDGVSRELRYCDYFGEGALLTDGFQMSMCASPPSCPCPCPHSSTMDSRCPCAQIEKNPDFRWRDSASEPTHRNLFGSKLGHFLRIKCFFKKKNPHTFWPKPYKSAPTACLHYSYLCCNYHEYAYSLSILA